MYLTFHYNCMIKITNLNFDYELNKLIVILGLSDCIYVIINCHYNSKFKFYLIVKT